MQQLGGERGVGDALINYRYQLVGDGRTALAIAPRASLVLPSGNERRGLGQGGLGLDLNLPISFALSDRLVTHWNAGLTKIPSTNTPVTYSAGASVIAAPLEKLHVMVETRWTHADTSTLVVSPGLRWAWDFQNGLQIVPGIAAPIGNDHSRALYVYLSLEHAFGR